MVNTIFKKFNEQPINIALFDKNCNIIHLLPNLIAKSRSVYVYTECVSRYEKENNRIFSLLGAAAVINDIPVAPKNTHAIISFEPYFSDNISVFGEHGYFINNNMPVFNGCNSLMLPKYADVYSTLWGLYSIGKIKSIGNAYCEKLYKNGYMYDIKNLP